MIPNDRMEPYQDEYGGIWRFYKATIPDTNFEYSYMLRLPAEIHNYIVDRYTGTNEQGPLPSNFKFTDEMIEDISRQWIAMEVRETGKGERPPDMTAFRAAVEETVNHRYHLTEEWSSGHDTEFRELVEQRELVVNEPFDLDQQDQGHQIHEELLSQLDRTDVTQFDQLTDEGQLGEVTPEHGDAFISQELLEPAPLNFGQSMKGIADYLRERLDHFREMFDTFGR